MPRRRIPFLLLPETLRGRPIRACTDICRGLFWQATVGNSASIASQTCPCKVFRLGRPLETCMAACRRKMLMEGLMRKLLQRPGGTTECAMTLLLWTTFRCALLSNALCSRCTSVAPRSLASPGCVWAKKDVHACASASGAVACSAQWQDCTCTHNQTLCCDLMGPSQISFAPACCFSVPVTLATT